MIGLDEDRIEIRLIASAEWRVVYWPGGKHGDFIRVGSLRWKAWVIAATLRKWWLRL